MVPRFEKIASTSMEPSESVKRLRQLEVLLLKHFPRTVHILNICKIGIQQRFPKQAQIEFYGYVEGENQWPNDEDVPLIVCIQRPNLHGTKGICLCSPISVTDEMGEAFEKLISWDEPQVFQAIPEPFGPTIRKLTKRHHNLNPKDSEGFPGTFDGILDIEKAKSLEIPKNVLSDNNLTIKPLEEKHAHEVASHWPFAKAHSEQAIADSVKTLVSCGLFTKEEELASSVLQSALGVFNILYTPDKFRRKGYGNIVMAWVSREGARQLGTYPLSEAEVWNAPSFKLVRKLGYEHIFFTTWFYYNPSNIESA